MKLNIFSDLRKPGLVPGKSLSLAQNYVFCFGETLIYMKMPILNDAPTGPRSNHISQPTKTVPTPDLAQQNHLITLSNPFQDHHNRINCVLIMCSHSLFHSMVLHNCILPHHTLHHLVIHHAHSVL